MVFACPVTIGDAETSTPAATPARGPATLIAAHQINITKPTVKTVPMNRIAPVDEENGNRIRGNPGGNLLPLKSCVDRM